VFGAEDVLMFTNADVCAVFYQIVCTRLLISDAPPSARRY
jgi:hypothetical protein